MKKVIYPGSGNNTQLLYDALDRCVKIEERTGGSLTSTKQFVWCGTERCEERDASGNVVSQFFGLGQKTSGSSFYYNKDHLGSVREVTNSSGAIVTQVAYTPWGEATLLQGSALPDFGYAGYYNHTRSGLNLTLYRAYSPGLGRWLSRDPLGESAGANLYGYVGNNPVSLVDPLGLAPFPPAPTDFPYGEPMGGSPLLGRQNSPFWYPTGSESQRAGENYISRRHGPFSPRKCNSSRPEGKWGERAWAFHQEFIEVTLMTGKVRHEGAGTHGYVIHEETFIDKSRYCPTCIPAESIGYEYPVGEGPPEPTNSIRVITRPDGVVINAYPYKPR